MIKENCMKKVALFLCLSIAFVTASFAEQSLKADDVIAKLVSQQSQVKDFSADIETSTKMTDARDTFILNGKIWSKGPKMAKMILYTPEPQTTITNGDKLVMIDAKGEKTVMDIPPVQGLDAAANNQGRIDFGRFTELFNISIKPSKVAGTIKLVCFPKAGMVIKGKTEMVIDCNQWVPIYMTTYNEKGKMQASTDIKYAQFDGISIPVKIVANAVVPTGKAVMEMEFSNVKINQGISDSEFTVN